MIETNKVYNIDCFEYMKQLEDKSIPFILTDIPYNEVSQDMGGIYNLDLHLGDADELKFDLIHFLDEIYRITSNSLCIFCGCKQFSQIFEYFKNKPGTTRPIIYEKTNPVPSNGQYVYLSGVEFAVWFKRKGAKVFNAHCKNTVFRYPIFGGKKRIHPTQKHPDLFAELIADNTNQDDIVFDPCAGGCTTALAAHKLGRRWICCELNKEFYDKSIEMLKKEINYEP